jgi:hypothetical protein
MGFLLKVKIKIRRNARIGIAPYGVKINAYKAKSLILISVCDAEFKC